jgi:hypothetical protein
MTHLKNKIVIYFKLKSNGSYEEEKNETYTDIDLFFYH